MSWSNASSENICKGGRDPTTTPTISTLLGQWPVLLRAHFALTEDPKSPYEGQFGAKLNGEGSWSKAAALGKAGHFLSKAEIVGVGVSNLGQQEVSKWG